MMKRQNVISAIVIIMGALVATANCQTTGMTLFLQQSPFEGGVITPSPGVHLFTPDTEVALVAIPKPGYQFVCWLGDVGDSTANRTFTYLNQPKVIVAVFERCQYEQLLGGSGESSLIASSGGVGGSGSSSFAGGGGGGGSGGGGDSPPPEPPPGPPPNPPPVPVPEPITILLLGSGSLLLLRKRSA